jgi:glycosyltransferase involved in cell wall biosynthesis
MIRGPLAVYRKARRQDASIYHFHDPELIPIALLLRAAGKRVIYDIHEDLPRTVSYKPYIPRWLCGFVAGLLEVVERWASRWFSALIAATPPIAERFRGANREVVVVHNYPRMEEICALPCEDHAARDGSLLYVGMRITRARGAEEMVRAMGLVPATLSVRLKLVGTWDPPDLVESLSRIRGWERTECVGWLRRTELAQVLRRASAGLALLHAEPNYVTAQPVKLFEYMCAGLPVIASDLPGCREIVASARCGLLVNPLDPQEIAQAIAYLWTHPQEAEAMGRRGFEAIQERYNWASEEEVLLRLYRRLCGCPSPNSAPSGCNP